MLESRPILAGPRQRSNQARQVQGAPGRARAAHQGIGGGQAQGRTQPDRRAKVSQGIRRPTGPHRERACRAATLLSYMISTVNGATTAVTRSPGQSEVEYQLVFTFTRPVPDNFF